LIAPGVVELVGAIGQVAVAGSHRSFVVRRPVRFETGRQRRQNRVETPRLQLFLARLHPRFSRFFVRHDRLRRGGRIFADVEEIDGVKPLCAELVLDLRRDPRRAVAEAARGGNGAEPGQNGGVEQDGQSSGSGGPVQILPGPTSG
jgi:hypothetical protein